MSQKKTTQPDGMQISSTSTTANTIGFFSTDPQDMVTPKVFYAPGVKERIDYLIQKCSKEVGWWGLVEKHPTKVEFTITEIFVPEQRVHGAETDISAEALGALAHELIDRGVDTTNLYYWGHSHVNMGVGPSAQDEQQVAEYLPTCRWFIRGIYNKAGLNKVDVYDTRRGIVFQCVANEKRVYGLSDTEIESLDKLISDNVKEAVVTTTTTNYSNYGGRTQGKEVVLNRSAGTSVYVIGKNAKEVAEYLRKQA